MNTGPVYLIGFMGCGKSTLGRAASAVSGLPYIDLDALTEEISGTTTPEIFRRGGAEAFRKAERKALEEVSRNGRCIVACGGGTPCHGDNMELMLRTGTVVWLQAARQRVLYRLAEAPAEQRPLLRDVHGDPQALAARVDALMAEREPTYSRAHLRFDSSRLDTQEEIDQTTKEFLRVMRLL